MTTTTCRPGDPAGRVVPGSETGIGPSVQAGRTYNRAVPASVTRDGGRLLPWLVTAISLAVGVAIIRPFTDVPAGFDTQASVLYFDRLVAGQRLELPLSTTPKPLITLIYGLLQFGTEWRLIGWATMLVHSAAAGLTAFVVMRAAGPAAGLAAGLVVAGTPLLIEDAAFGNAVPWALLGWLVAAVLLIRDRPRPILAGFALLLAALSRLETLVIVAMLGAALTWARFGPWVLPVTRPALPGRLWTAVVIPFAALPVLLVHDWLLTGDPMYWLTVSQRYSDARRGSLDILDPIERVRWFVRRYRDIWPVIPLGLVGLLVLIRGRRWGELVALAGMGPGIAAFVVFLAARSLYAPDRYALPVDIAVLLAAAVGFGSLVGAAAARVAPTSLPRRAVIAGALAATIAGVAAVRAGPFDPGLARDVTDVRILNENAARILPLLRAAGADSSAGGGPRWIVPTAVRPRLSVDLGAPLTEVAGLAPGMADPGTTTLVPGQVVYHDLRGDIPKGGYGAIESAGDIPLGPVVLRPLLVDPDAGIWVYLVGAAR